MRHKLRTIDKGQFYIQLFTAILFMYKSIEVSPISPINVLIGLLLLTGWSLGAVRHRTVRRRLRNNENKN
jgi:hypothetical protein